MISNISIQNFKAFHKMTDVKVGAFTLLTGINGRGKSTFLQMLLLLSQSIRNSEKHTPMNLITNGDWVQLGNFKELINVYSTESQIRFRLQTDEEIDNDFELTYNEIEEKANLGELCSMKVNGIETFSEAGGYNQTENTPSQKIAPIFSGYTSLMNLQNLYYVAADRNRADNKENLTTEQVHLDCLGRNVINVIYQQDEVFQAELEYRLSQIFEGATFKIIKEANSLRLYMDAMNNGQNFKPVNVGYGYSYILTLLTAELLAKKGDIVIIENPEAHLHPSAQATMMKFFLKDIADKGIQIFMETHSDHIVNATLLGIRNPEINLTKDNVNILFFNKNEEADNGIYIQNLEISPNGRVKNPPMKFCDQYAIDLQALMGF